MAVGARHPLIAFNINLASEDLAIAKKVARGVRGMERMIEERRAMGARGRAYVRAHHDYAVLARRFIEAVS